MGSNPGYLFNFNFTLLDFDCNYQFKIQNQDNFSEPVGWNSGISVVVGISSI